MLKTNLITILRALSAQELRELGQFISTEHLNSRKDVALLYNHIRPFLHKSSDKLKKEIIFPFVFPDEAYNEKKLRYTISFLHKVTERFLIYKELLADQLQAQVYLNKALRKRGLVKPFYKANKQAINIFEKNPFRSNAYYEQSFQIEFEKYIFMVNTERNAPRNLQQLNNITDTGYLIRKLRLTCISLAHQSVYKIDYNEGLLNAIIKDMERSIFFKNPIVALYYYYIKAFTSKEDHFYKKFRVQLNKHGAIIPRNELQGIYVLAINYCIKKSNLGNSEYLPEVFDLYKVSLKNNFLLQNEFLSRFSFKNIVGLGLRLKAFGWVRNFIEEYQEKLNPKYRSNYVDYNLAKLWYAEKKLKEAMLKLVKVEYDDLFLNLDAKVLLLKIYYELDEFEVLESHIHSFQKYVQRKKLIGYHQENYLNIIALTKKLLELNPYSNQEKEVLKNKIKATTVLAERDWLYSQVK